MTETWPRMTPMPDLPPGSGQTSMLPSPVRELAMQPTITNGKIIRVDPPTGGVYLAGSAQKPGTTPTIEIHNGSGWVGASIDHFRVYSGSSLRVCATQSLIRIPAWRRITHLRQYPFSRIRITAAAGWATSISGFSSDAAAITSVDPWQFDTATPATTGAPAIAGNLCRQTSVSSAIGRDLYLWYDGPIELFSDTLADLRAKFAWVSPSGKPSWAFVTIDLLIGLPVLKITFTSNVSDGWEFTIEAGLVLRDDEASAAASVTIAIRHLAWVDLAGPQLNIRDHPPITSTDSHNDEPKVFDVDGVPLIARSQGAWPLLANDGTADETSMVELPADSWIRRTVERYGSIRWGDRAQQTLIYRGPEEISVATYPDPPDYTPVFQSVDVWGFSVVAGAALVAPTQELQVYNWTKQTWYNPLPGSPYFANSESRLVGETFSPIPVWDGAPGFTFFDPQWEDQNPVRQQYCTSQAASGWEDGDVCQVFFDGRVQCVATPKGLRHLTYYYRPGGDGMNLRPDTSAHWGGISLPAIDPTHVCADIRCVTTDDYRTGYDIDDSYWPEVAPLRSTTYACGYGVGTLNMLTRIEDWSAASSPGALTITCEIWAIAVAVEVNSTMESPGVYGFASPWTMAESVVMTLREVSNIQQGLFGDQWDNEATYVEFDTVVADTTEIVGGVTIRKRTIWEAITSVPAGEGPPNATYWVEVGSGDYWVIYSHWSGPLVGHSVETWHGYSPYLKTLSNHFGGFNLFTDSDIEVWSEAVARHPHTMAATGEGDLHYPGWIHEDDPAAGDF